MEQLRREQPHFLVVTYPAQGHINPSHHLARRLARTTGVRVTFSTAVSAHRRMFPSLSSPDQEFSDGLLSYIPYSDGSDDGIKRNNSNSNDNKDAAADNPMLRVKREGPRTLSAVLDRLAARGERVTCVVYTILLPWVADVARAHRVPAVLCWIQPATVLAIYYRYFHGYAGVIGAAADAGDPARAVTLPGLAPLRVRDLPSFLATTKTDDPYAAVLDELRETVDAIGRGDDDDGSRAAAGVRPTVLVNTFDALEPRALKSVEDLDLIAIGPVIPSLEGPDSEGGADLFAADEKRYMEWLDSKAEGSVVYVSFGSMSVVRKRQMEEIRKGLEGSGRPYLWVVRRDNREAESIEPAEEADEKKGMVVEWCSQIRVLNHAAVGCFVTHCGWNSTLESVAAGVPTVCAPQWTDQATNAWLMAEEWGMGLRVETNGEGLLEGEELRRCLQVVMGDGERGAEMRRRARMWKDEARAAIGDGGSSQRNLRAFVDQIASRN